MSSSSSEPTALSSLLEPLALLARAVGRLPWSRLASALTTIIALPLALVAAPLRLLARSLLVVFGPLLHVLSYGVACARGVAVFFASLEPLYTFFGVAATIGILAGLILAISSTIITSSLGMQDDERDLQQQQQQQRRQRQKKLEAPWTAAASSSISSSSSKRPPQRLADTHRDESSSNDAEWRWLKDVSPTRRWPASGLLSQTIHEEDDDTG